MARVQIGGVEKTVAPFNGRKALASARILDRIAESWPAILAHLAEFRATYRRENVLELDRAQAQFRYPPVTLVGRAAEEAGVPDGTRLPSRISGISDQDWADSGNVLRIPQDPSWMEELGAIFPTALRVAEAEVLRLLALGTVGKDQLRDWKRDGDWETVEEKLLEVGEQLIDDSNDVAELVELAIVVAEQLRDQFAAKASRLGPRVGALLKMAGLDPERFRTPTPTAPSPETPPAAATTSSTEKPTSSTDSPPPTDGTSEPSSTTPTGDSSSPSAIA